MKCISGLYIFRHGARDPIKENNYKILNKNHQNFTGNLTKIGREQTKILGQHFNIKIKNTHQNVYYINSSENRCIETKRIFMNEIEGKKKSFLLPYKNDEYLRNYSLKKQKLKNRVHSMVSNDDKILINKELKNKNIDIPLLEIEKFLLSCKLMEILENYKENITTNHFSILIEKYKDLMLKVYLTYFYSSSKIIKTGVGRFPSLLESFLNTSNKDILFIFAHDNTIHYILSFLGIKNFPFCHFNGYLSFEIFKDKDNSSFVNFSYNYKPFENYNLELKINQKQLSLESDYNSKGYKIELRNFQNFLKCN